MITSSQSIDRSERESLGAVHNVQDVTTFTVMVRINPRPPSGGPHRSIDAAHPKRPLSRVPEGGTWWLGRSLPELPSPGGMIDQNTESIENSNTPQKQCGKP
jgi:hypothetical protein